MSRTSKAPPRWATAFILASALIALEAAFGFGYLAWLTESAVIHTRRGTYHRFFGGVFFLGLAFTWFAFYVHSSLGAKKVWRVTYASLYALCAFVQLSYLRFMGRLTTPGDVGDIFTSNPIEAAHIGWRAIDWRATLLIALYGAGLALVPPPTKPTGARRFASVVSAMILLSALTGRFTNGYAPLPSICAVFRTVTAAAGRDWMRSHRASPREEVAFRATRKPTRNIVLVVDESVRGDHLSINGYSRLTTPFLSSLQSDGILHNWGLATCGATSSTMAGKLLMTGYDLSHSRPDSLVSDEESALDTWPTVFHYAKAMGFTTRYFNGQNVFGGFGFRAADRVQIDFIEGTESLGRDVDSDKRIAERVKTALINGTGQFIVVNKMGIHLPYDRRYRPSSAKWGPRQEFAFYDNALLYNVDGFFEILLSDRDVLRNATVLYTSDHGERLRRFDNVGYHGGSSRDEAIVPLFLIGKEAVPPNPLFEASHANILPTLLDLMGYPDKLRAHPYAESLLHASASGPRERWFVSADGRRRTPWRYIRFSDAKMAEAEKRGGEEHCPNGEPPPCAIRKIGIKP